MPNLNLPTNISPGVTATFEVDVEAAWAELNRLSKDTGWRNITSLLINGWTATHIMVRRTIDRVYWEFRNLNGSAATSATFLDLTGLDAFKPPFTAYETPEIRGTSGSGFIRCATGGLSATVGFTFPTNTIHSLEYRTASAFPAEPWPGI